MRSKLFQLAGSTGTGRQLRRGGREQTKLADRHSPRPPPQAGSLSKYGKWYTQFYISDHKEINFTVEWTRSERPPAPGPGPWPSSLPPRPPELDRKPATEGASKLARRLAAVCGTLPTPSAAGAEAISLEVGRPHAAVCGTLPTPAAAGAEAISVEVGHPGDSNL